MERCDRCLLALLFWQCTSPSHTIQRPFADLS
ncbi:hypothetical protein BsWGS_21285 [Bradybaena similaris]